VRILFLARGGLLDVVSDLDSLVRCALKPPSPRAPNTLGRPALPGGVMLVIYEL
jgi:hypothetical protein